EVETWIGVLGSIGLAGVAAGLENSFEARSAGGQSWFPTYLGRQPNPGEVGFWVNQVQQGFTEGQGLGSFLAPPGEFAPARNNHDAFVTMVTQQLLGRNPTPSEMVFWQKIVAPTSGRFGAAYSELTSAEFRTRAVTSLYLEKLGRPPTKAELNALVNSGLNLTQ